MIIPQCFSPMFRPHRCFAAAPVAAMPLLQIGWAVVANPNLSLSILPNQNLKWKVNSAAGRREHYGSAGLWVPKNQQLGRMHFHSYLFRFAAVVHHREQR